MPCFTNRPALLVVRMQLRLDNDLTVWGKEKEAAEHIFLLCSTFNVNFSIRKVFHNIILSKLERYGFDGWTFQ